MLQKDAQKESTTQRSILASCCCALITLCFFSMRHFVTLNSSINLQLCFVSPERNTPVKMVHADVHRPAQFTARCLPRKGPHLQLLKPLQALRKGRNPGGYETQCGPSSSLSLRTFSCGLFSQGTHDYRPFEPGIRGVMQIVWVFRDRYSFNVCLEYHAFTRYGTHCTIMPPSEIMLLC